MTQADQKILTELFSEGYYTIPNFQRNYAWKEQQIRDLLEDAFYLHRQEDSETSDSNPEIHYFGQVLLEEGETKEVGGQPLQEYKIIDGQQRILTIPIFVRAILDELNKLDPEEVPPSEIEDTTEPLTPLEIYDRHLGAVEDTFFKIDGTQRVTPTDADQSVYNEIIEETGSISESSADRPSNEYLQSAYKQISDRLEDYFIPRVKTKLESESSTDSSSTDDSVSEEDEEEDTAESDEIPLQEAEPGDRGDIDRVYALELIDLLEILAEVFTVTRFIIDNTSEAGRFFETENDRGRDLTTKDKIKGYLIYCANRLDNNNFAEDISHTFKKVTETITQYEEADESDVDTFLKAHWRLFNGDPTYDRSSNEITSIHRSIKQYANHAHLERKDDNLEEWIRVYTASLEASVQPFALSRFPNSIDTNTDPITTEQRKALIGIRACGNPSNTAALLTAAHIEYASDSPEKFTQILNLLEKFTFRVYVLSGESKASYRSKMNRMAFKLHWAESSWLDTVDSEGDVFGVESDELEDHEHTRQIEDSRTYKDLEEGYRQVCDQIESGIGNYSPRTRTRSRLERVDILDGDDVDDNWKGIDSNGLGYLFYNYEAYLRDDLNTNQDSPSWEDWSDKVNILQLITDEVDQDLGLNQNTIEQYKYSLASLIPLETHTESDLQGSWDEIFESAFLEEGSFVGHDSGDTDVGPFATLFKFGEGKDDTDSPDLTEGKLASEKRERVSWAMDRWSVDSRAQVLIVNNEIVDSDDLNKIANDVRTHYKEISGSSDSAESYNIPNVEVVNPTDADSSDEWEVFAGDHTVGDDPSIDNIAVRIYIQDDSITYEPVNMDELEDTDESESGEEDSSGSLGTPPYRIDRAFHQSDVGDTTEE